MTNDVAGLNIYLEQARVNAVRADAIAVVIGSEAADLDSMVSALLHALLASTRPGAAAPPLVPVINCPRADFKLRTEAVFLFDRVGLAIDALLFIDEIDLDSAHQAGALHLTLVDHNTLCAGQESYAGAVEAILDHHEDAGHYARANPRTIEPVGSATTLVAEAMLRERPALVGAGLARLLLGAILLDTVNLDPAAQRVTAKDREVSSRLAPIAGLDTGELFEILQAEKFNVSGLSTADLLRKDYKAWDTPSASYGISTVMTSIGDWITRDPDLVSGLDSFLCSRDLTCLLAMMAYTDAAGEFCRDLALYTPDAVLAGELCAVLEANDPGLSRIEPGGLKRAGKVMLFTRQNTSISRKKLQPLLQDFFCATAAGQLGASRSLVD